MLLLRVIFIASLFSLSACSLLSPKTEYVPDNKVLKDAVVGVPYYSKINILGGGVIGEGGMEGHAGAIVPSNSGISLRNCQLPEWEIKDMSPKDSNNYNCVEVYGVPIKPGVIKINISGGMYGSMIAPASEFCKDYILNVVQQ